MHFERNYQELWRNHVETKRPNDGVVYDEFLFIREIMKLTQTSHQTTHQSPVTSHQSLVTSHQLDLGIRLRFVLFFFFFVLFNSIFY